MTEQTSRTSLYKKIAVVAGSVQPVKPTGYNQDTKKKYADGDDIAAALKPILAEYDLSVTMQIGAVSREDTGQRTGSGSPYVLTRLECTFVIADGETGECAVYPWYAEAADHMKDKGVPKALTIARRTFLIHTFHIIAEEEKQLWGGDGQQDEKRPAQQPTQPRLRPTQPPLTTEANGKTPRRTGLMKRIEELESILAERGYDHMRESFDAYTDAQLIEIGKRLKAEFDKPLAEPPGTVSDTATIP